MNGQTSISDREELEAFMNFERVYSAKMRVEISV